MKAIKITGYTLIGVGDQQRPQERGNCFSIEADDGNDYRIVNFNLENLGALQKLGLKFPIECKTIGNSTAIIHDGRIGERWYQNRYCEVCCPDSLLPVTQRDIHERDVMRGIRKEFRHSVMYELDVKPEFE